MATQVETGGWARDQMAQRAAKELKDGYYVNLGIGIRRWSPTTCPKA
jgi:3-oxoacid CoA-transferase subunit B